MPVETGSDAQLLSAEGNALAEAGDFQAAAEAFRLSIVQHPNCAKLHELLAQCLLLTDDLAAAYASATQAVVLDPAWAEGYLTVARVARECGLVNDAVTAFKKCQDLDSTNLEARDELEQLENELEVALAKRVGVPGLRVSQDFGAGGGPGCVVWESGVLLAAFLVQRQGSNLAGVRVLELGAGTGLVGIVGGALGARVTLTDLPALLPLLRRNVQNSSAAIQQGGGLCQVAEADWSRPENRILCGDQAYDVVVGSDLVYSRAQIQPLTRTLHKLVACNPSARFYFAHKSRDEGIDVDWLAALTGLGLRLTLLPLEPADLGLKGANRVKLYSTHPL